MAIVLSLPASTASISRGDPPPAPADSAVVWLAEQQFAPAGASSAVLGKPRIIRDASGSYAVFDGVADGFIVPVNPVEGWRAFTIEILFEPDTTGPHEQRFLNIDDTDKHRITMETRLNSNGQWALDTFLLDGRSRLPLLNEKLLHPAGQWHWAALRYDGQTMTSFVDGKKELEGRVDFSPMKSGQTSVGVRLNRIYWFKGGIRELVFHAGALSDSSLSDREVPR